VGVCCGREHEFWARAVVWEWGVAVAENVSFGRGQVCESGGLLWPIMWVLGEGQLCESGGLLWPRMWVLGQGQLCESGNVVVKDVSHELGWLCECVSLWWPRKSVQGECVGIECWVLLNAQITHMGAILLDCRLITGGTIPKRAYWAHVGTPVFHAGKFLFFSDHVWSRFWSLFWKKV